MGDKCGRCGIEFEPKTPRVERSYSPVRTDWHAGCIAAQGQKNKEFLTALKADCSHYTPAEDVSKFAFAHRTWGCPDKGAVWPHGYLDE